MFHRFSIRRGLVLPSLLLGALVVLTSCETVRPVRTLPSWVRGVYIPMFRNDTPEPGLEEVATQLTQEEFLADGRVRIVQKRDADLIVHVTIKHYGVQADHLSDDRIPDRSLVLIVADLKLYDPLGPDEPLASLGEILTERSYSTDPRSTRYMVKSDMNRDILQYLARQIVDQTITGFPTQLRDIPDGVTIPNQGGPIRAEDADIEDRLSRFPFF